MHRSSFLFVVAVLSALLLAGCSSAGESEGVSSATCAKPLVGDEVCGDELVAFCKQRYDPDVNEEVCHEVLVDAGYNPERIARRRAIREEEQITGIKHADTKTLHGTRGDLLSLAGESSQERVGVNIDRLAVLPPDPYSDPDGDIVGVYITVVNQGTKVLSDSPSTSIKLLMAGSRQLDPSYNGSPVCGADDLADVRIPPGSRRRGCVPFEVRNVDGIRGVQYSPNYGNGQLGEWKLDAADVQQ